MIHIKDDFAKGPVSQVPTSWFNAVGKFINNFVGGHGIKVSKNGDSTPSVVEIDPSVVMSAGRQTTPSSTTGISITPDYSTTSQAYLDMADWKPPAKLTGDDTAHTPVGWERGKTAWKNGVYVDENHPAVGASIKVCSHSIIRTVSGNQRLELFFTRLDFDENGLLVRAVPGVDWFTSPYT